MEEKEKEPAKTELLEELQRKLEECEKQKAEYLAGWQRSRADFINYKREEVERIGDLVAYAREEFLLQMLEFIDNFDAAEKNFSDSLRENDYVKGLLQVGAQMRDFLKKQGVLEMKTVGNKFDPNFHEVVGETSEGGVESGIIVEEVQKGYTINGRLLRPAKVKVAK